jgi:hypothetical protein
MEYRGIRYEVVQTASPNGFKWVVHLDSTHTKTGISHSRRTAILDAERAIDKTLGASKE